MRLLLPAAVALILATSAVSAQNAPPASTGAAGGKPSNEAVNPPAAAPSDDAGTSHIVAPTALQNGANSFTEGQAKSRIESAGFAGVSALTQDVQGIWRGTATRAGTSVAVGLDYKGNIGAQ